MAPDAPGPEPPLPRVDTVATTVDLLDRARSGDQGAMDLLFARHAGPLRRWASGRLPARARTLVDTEDLVQDALVQTFKKIGAFEARGVGALLAYLRCAVINRIRDELRRDARRPGVTSLEGSEVDPGLSPLDHAIGRERTECYERALARLKEEDQEVIIARIEMGYTYQELADSLGKPSADAARKAAERALVRLATEMARDAG